MIFLDYNATTPAAPEVLDAVIPWLRRPSNPSSAHHFGRTAFAALDVARQQVAAATGARPGEITFTSGATESNNIAVQTAVGSATPSRRRAIVSAIEHKAVLEPVGALRTEGWTVDVVPVGPDGVLDVDDLLARLAPDVGLVSLHLANNEVGTVQPVRRVAEAAHEVGALVHTDATQALGKMHVDLTQLDVDLASFSSHKVYGMQGTGALYSRRRLRVAPLSLGGAQEQGRRPGTENVSGIIAFGVAAELATTRLQEYRRRAAHHTRLLFAELSQNVSGVLRVLPPGAEHLPNTLSLRCQGVDGEALMANSPGVAFSTGSACSSMVPESSHVLRAVLGSEVAASECVRISTGWPTSDDEIIEAARQLGSAVVRVREVNG